MPPEKTYGSILSSLQSKLGKFDSKEIAELTSTDTIDFEEIAKKKTAVELLPKNTCVSQLPIIVSYDFS